MLPDIDERRVHLSRFYSLLDRLEINIGGARVLSMCSGLMRWPERGVYFFREAGENRSDTGQGPRIVRVGTHALKIGGSAKLWTRLSQHKGQAQSGSGNHRGSIFRLIVGAALIRRDGLQFPTWGIGSSAKRDVRMQECDLEFEVTEVIGMMPFLWLPIQDQPGPKSRRGYIERNSIALLSNYQKPPLDPRSHEWLGQHCDRERVRNSGIWNSNHVDETYDPAFLNELEHLVCITGGD
jgi:hypothetical protein